MPLKRRNQHVFQRRLYAGQLEKVILLKRLDDQNEGSVTAYTLYQCRRGNITKSGEAIYKDTGAFTYLQWLIPCTELRRVGVNYLNVLDRIVDQFGMFWEPESPETITLAIFDNFYVIPARRVDPFPNEILVGIPGIGLPLS
jgi:hypothetical protein